MPSIGDTLFQFTEWLRTTPLVDYALWIGETKFCLWLQVNFFAIPIMQTTHILAIAAGFVSVLKVNLRTLGLSGLSQTLPQTTRRYTRVTWWALLVLVISGIGMIIGEPVRELINPIFWIKMVGVIALILLSIWYYGVLHRRGPSWDSKPGGQALIRASSIGLILLWCAIMAGGRWIAYAPT